MDLKTIAPDVDNDITTVDVMVTPPIWTFDVELANCDLYEIHEIRYNAGWQLKVKIVIGSYTLDNWLSGIENEHDPNALTTKFHFIYQGEEVFRVAASRYKTIISFHTGIEAYADILKEAILTQRTELQLYPSRGIPYFETAFDSPLKVRMWADAVRRTTNSFPWVARILDFEYNFSDEIQDNDGIIHRNGLTYTLRVLTDLGVATVRSDET